MKLSELLFRVADGEIIPTDPPILQLTQNAEEADKNSLFICVKGARFDGHKFARKAYENGCRAFLAEYGAILDLPDDSTIYRTQDTRRAMASVACRFFGNPTEKMRVVAITGTKGKTTTALLTAHILNTNGISCGYIGTNGITFGNIRRETDNTTPDAITLQKTFSEMLQNGIRNVVIEVSSQALKQYRADEISLSGAVMTNLSVDHIGVNEHPTFDDYKRCKKRLFTDFSPKKTIVFSDGGKADALLCDLPEKIVCGRMDHANYRLLNPVLNTAGSRFGIGFDVQAEGKTESAFLPLIGICNAENAVLSLAIAKEIFGVSLHDGIRALKTAVVPGRSEVYRLENGCIAVIDYAHNQDSLQRLLSSLREYRPKRLICLFGSVGERTQIRRRELGEVASRLADFCILTSDNPGREDPEKIMQDILVGFADRETPYLCIPDREKAISKGVELSERGDILVLAGKGQENYQLIGMKKIPFSEREILFKEKFVTLTNE